jgi:branched-chain amino acid transport system substrate-binding protein
MPSRRRRRLGPVALLAALAATVAGGGCGDDERPLRIGVIVDCVGVNRPLRAAELSGAQLPLIERGAHARGPRPSDGLDPVEIAGRPVELVPGCSEIWEFSTLTTEARRLAELEHVDAIVGGGGSPEEVVLRDVARREPGVLFLPAVHGPREATLRHPAPNLYRFAGDYGQGAAGLGTYAYRDLGWRRAAIVLTNWDLGWGPREAFAAEFCAAGGRVVSQVPVDAFDPAGRDVASVPMNVDGVAVFTKGFFGPEGFLKALARRVRDPAREILLGPGVMDDPALLRSTGRALAGVTGSSFVRPERLRAYLSRYEKAFPGTSRDVAGSELVTGYRDAVEALVTALERADGDTARLRPELARLRVQLLGGPVHLDHNGQAVVSTSLVRMAGPAAGGGTPVLEPVDEIPLVDQSIGGLLSSALVPDDGPAACRSGQRRPPWAGVSGGNGADGPGEARVLGPGGEPAGPQPAPN